MAQAGQVQQEILQAIPDLILRMDSQGRFLGYNQPANFALYASPEQFLGKNVMDIMPGEIAQRAIGCIYQTIRNESIQLMEYELVIHNQAHYYEARFVKSGDFEVMAIIRDITYKKQIEQRLEFLSLKDSLTEVYNRAYFEEQMLKLRGQGGKNAGIIICDVDGLKLINDTLGHFAGDELLRAAAKILRGCVAYPDVIARIGGDEFAVLVSQPETKKMNELSKTIRLLVEDYNKTNPKLLLSLSIGWAIGYGDIDALFREADNNMYREKMHKGQSTRNTIVQAMMQALEARDYITEGHAERLESLIEKFAQRIQLSAPMIADLKLLAKFHDIGKVGIPDNILFKPGKLTPEEIIVMRRHCEIGFRIAKSVPDLAPIADWILKHQEWWNGKGYPLYLAGEEIPLACRILAIADAYDAMTNDRPYRKALDDQAAIAELRRCAGTQFDPKLTEAFIDMLTASDKG
ncbi:sensor domain-containing diguanylate cyclase/phosphohydrolase [Sporomusa acidovorans]|uniref:Cyclic di-GMP phosphodiesterase response regulator RpfG n=1 Tax=Sporomusa acidovorans (strain ATCC 49682 / DSM 3132 / Mol) TaxID=1123286 RepID=A0ABZ3JBM1_SPOA4|nr:HD domain-containing phosphohydrolase [Sporomusa acidovorans]OZC13245.1 cyclic di-GMP phosphodiesterase response regulator RpfG [Sporomusa acidovorans DSM 3132]SDD99877.1 PAS domain S-box-containing protein/diguanylate cyclase (GGDEF) domain-containing protein [Sporomusa acidovorans]